MNVIDRYIGKNVIIAVFIVFLAIISLYSFIAFIRVSDYIGEGNFTLYNAVHFVLFTLPSRSYEVFPFSVLLGTLMGLAHLNSNSEIVAMRANGVATSRIISAVLKVGFVLAIFIFIIGEYVAPITENIAQREKNYALYNTVTLDIKHEIWIRDEHTYTNIRSVLADKSLQGLTIYSFHDNGNLKSSSYAERAIYEEPDWVLENINQTIFADQKVITRTLDKRKWKTPLDLDLVEVISSKEKALSAIGVYKYANYLDKNGLDSTNYYLIFWQKVTAPFTLLVMLLLAFPFAIGHNRSTNMGAKLLVGIVIGLVFNMGNKIIAEIGLVYEYSPLISATFLTVLTFGLSIFMIRRIR